MRKKRKDKERRKTTERMIYIKEERNILNKRKGEKQTIITEFVTGIIGLTASTHGSVRTLKRIR